MSLDFRPTRKEIVARLRELPQDLYESVVPDDSELRTSGGIILPYNVIMWTNPILVTRGRGIVGVRKDLFSMTCTVHSISPNYESAVDTHAGVFDKLTGFQPINASELRPWGGFSTDTSTDKAKPTKYIHSQGFSMYVNTILEK